MAVAVQGQVEAGGPLGWCGLLSCAAPCSSWEEYLEHRKIRHALSCGQGAYQCHLCLHTGPSAKQAQHLEAHRLSDLPCPRCSARFLMIHSLRLHLSRFHRAGGPNVPGAP